MHGVKIPNLIVINQLFCKQLFQ